MILAIGEILFDVFPRYSRIGGAPFNFAYHAKHLGMDVAFITRIGDDAAGSDILSILEKSGFDTRFVQIDKNHETGRVIVTPDGRGSHEFEIRADVAYDHIDFPGKPADIAGGRPVELIYFGTLAQRTEAAFNAVQGFLGNRDPKTKCFYDINLRTGNYNNAIIQKSLESTDILKLNEDELAYIKGLHQRNEPDPASARWLMKNFGIEIVSLTKGAAGSDIFTANEHKHADVTASEIADTVGAGDAYAAILAVGYLKGLPLEKILSIATAFSSKICTIKGAVPDDPEFYEPFRRQLSGAGYV
ncbi:MAG: PfkB family carbohydrate kinase [Desulfosalsimonadaceae bacterium]